MRLVQDAAVRGGGGGGGANQTRRLPLASWPSRVSCLVQVGNHSYTELQAVDLPWSVATNVTIGCPTCTGWDYYGALGEWWS